MKKKQVSIVDYLKSQGQPSSFNDRKALAKQYGIKNYRGTAKQNLNLLSQAQGGNQTNNPTINGVMDNVFGGNKVFNKNNTLNVDKPLSSTDLATLKEAVKKYGLDKVTAKLKKDGLYDKVIGQLKTLDNNQQDKIGKDILSNIFSGDTSLKNGNLFKDTNQSNQVNQVNNNIISQEASLKEAQGIVKPYFDQQNSRLTTDYNQNMSTINRLIAYTDTTVANKLKQSNTTFARSMTNATNNYTSRNIIGSGIAVSNANSATEQLKQSQDNANYYAKRSKISNEGRKANLQTKYNNAQQDLGQNQTFYTDLFAKQLQQGKAKNIMQDYMSAQQRVSFGNNTEANSLNFNTTNPTTPANKVITGSQANKKSLNLNK